LKCALSRIFKTDSEPTALSGRNRHPDEGQDPLPQTVVIPSNVACLDPDFHQDDETRRPFAVDPIALAFRTEALE